MKNLTWVKEDYALLIMRCVALRCVALRCVALRNHFVFKYKSSKKRNILGKEAGKARNFKTAHALVASRHSLYLRGRI